MLSLLFSSVFYMYLFNYASAMWKNCSFRHRCVISLNLYIHFILCWNFRTIYVTKQIYRVVLPARQCWNFKQSVGARNRVGIGLSYLPPRLHSLAELVPWYRFLGLHNSFKISSRLARLPRLAESIPRLHKSLKYRLCMCIVFPYTIYMHHECACGYILYCPIVPGASKPDFLRRWTERSHVNKVTSRPSFCSPSCVQQRRVHL